MTIDAPTLKIFAGIARGRAREIGRPITIQVEEPGLTLSISDRHLTVSKSIRWHELEGDNAPAIFAAYITMLAVEFEEETKSVA